MKFCHMFYYSHINVVMVMGYDLKLILELKSSFTVVFSTISVCITTTYSDIEYC